MKNIAGVIALLAFISVANCIHINSTTSTTTSKSPSNESTTTTSKPSVSSTPSSLAGGKHEPSHDIQNVSTTISSPSGDTNPPHEHSQCHGGWISFKDSCYYISQKTLPWAQARIDCSAKAATLFVVNSDLEWDKIRHYAVRAMWSWIGLSASKNIRHPVWEAPSNLNIDKSLPWQNKLHGHGAAPGIACAAYYAAPDPTYAYTSYYDCNIRNYYICERNSSLPRIEPIVGGGQ